MRPSEIRRAEEVLGRKLIRQRREHNRRLQGGDGEKPNNLPCTAQTISSSFRFGHINVREYFRKHYNKWTTKTTILPHEWEEYQTFYNRIMKISRKYEDLKRCIPDATKPRSGCTMSKEYVNDFMQSNRYAFVDFNPSGENVRIPDGTKVRCGRVFDEEKKFGLGVAPVTCIAVSPDGKRIVHVIDDWWGMVLWDIHEPSAWLEGHQDAVLSVSFSPDGKQVVSASKDWTIRLWDVESRTEVKKLELSSTSQTRGINFPFLSAAFSSDGTRVVSVLRHDSEILWDDILYESDYIIILWDVESGNEVKRFKTSDPKVYIYEVVFSPDDRQIVGGYGDKTVRLWDVESGALLKTFEGHTDDVRSVAFLSDGKKVLSGSWDKTVRLWDVESGALLKTFEGHTGAVKSVAVSADGRKAVSGSRDKTVRLWDVESGALLKTFEGHTDDVNSVAFLSDKQIVSGSDDKTVRLWETDSDEDTFQCKNDILEMPTLQCPEEKEDEFIIPFSPVPSSQYFERRDFVPAEFPSNINYGVRNNILNKGGKRRFLAHMHEDTRQRSDYKSELRYPEVQWRKSQGTVGFNSYISAVVMNAFQDIGLTNWGELGDYYGDDYAPRCPHRMEHYDWPALQPYQLLCKYLMSPATAYSYQKRDGRGNLSGDMQRPVIENFLVSHGVGTGKTLTMIESACNFIGVDERPIIFIFPDERIIDEFVVQGICKFRTLLRDLLERYFETDEAKSIFGEDVIQRAQSYDSDAIHAVRSILAPAACVKNTSGGITTMNCGGDHIPPFSRLSYGGIEVKAPIVMLTYYYAGGNNFEVSQLEEEEKPPEGPISPKIAHMMNKLTIDQSPDIKYPDVLQPEGTVTPGQLKNLFNDRQNNACVNPATTQLQGGASTKWKPQILSSNMRKAVSEGTRVGFFNAVLQYRREGVSYPKKLLKKNDQHVMEGKILFLDEAHNFLKSYIQNKLTDPKDKRRYTKIAKRLRSAKDTLLYCFTATPVGMNPKDAIEIMDVVHRQSTSVAPTYEGYISYFIARPTTTFPKHIPGGYLPNFIRVPLEGAGLIHALRDHGMKINARGALARRKKKAETTEKQKITGREKRMKSLNLTNRYDRNVMAFHTLQDALHRKMNNEPQEMLPGDGGEKWREIAKNNLPKLYAIAESIVKRKMKTVVAMHKDGMRTFLMLLRLMDADGQEHGCMTRTMVIDMDAYTEGVSFKNVRRIILADIPPTYTQLIQLVGRASQSCAQMEMRNADVPEELIVDAYMTVLDRQAIINTLKDFRNKKSCARGKAVDSMWYGPYNIIPKSDKPTCKTIPKSKTLTSDAFRLDFFDGFTSERFKKMFDYHVRTPNVQGEKMTEWNAYRAEQIQKMTEWRGAWREKISKKSGRTYYYNTQTRKKQWAPPSMNIMDTYYYALRYARFKALELETGVASPVLRATLLAMGQQPNAVITNQSTFKKVVPYRRKTQVAATLRMMQNKPQGPVEQAIWNRFFRDEQRNELKIHPQVTRLAESFRAIKMAVLHNIAQHPFDTSPIPEEFKLQDELNKIKIEKDAIGIEAAFCALHTLSVDRFLMRAPSKEKGRPQCSEANVSDMTRFVSELLEPSPSLMSSSPLYSNPLYYTFHGLKSRFRREGSQDSAERYRKNKKYEEYSGMSIGFILTDYLSKYTYIMSIQMASHAAKGEKIPWTEYEFAVNTYSNSKDVDNFLVMKESFFKKVQAFMDDDSKYIFVYSLILHGSGQGHANMFAINKLYNTCVRFEPHGAETNVYDFKKVDDAIKQKMKERFPHLTYVRQKYWCPLAGVQYLESEFSKTFDFAKEENGVLLTKTRRSGYCVVHSYMFAYYFCAHPELDINGVYELMHRHPEDVAKAARRFIVFAVDWVWEDESPRYDSDPDDDSAEIRKGKEIADAFFGSRK